MSDVFVQTVVATRTSPDRETVEYECFALVEPGITVLDLPTIDVADGETLSFSLPYVVG